MMTWLRHSIALTSLILLTATVQAGQDPIGWSLAGSFPAQTTVNLQYKVTYTFVNNFPRTMPTPLFIKQHPSSGEFSFEDNCSGMKLNQGQTCTVGITFVPTSSGSKSVSVDEDYGANVVPLPKLTTNASVNSTPLVTGIVTTNLPANIGTGEHRPVVFQFINNGNGAVLGPFTYTSNYPADGSFHEQTNTCTSLVTLPPGASCSVSGILSARNTTTYAVGATLSYTGGSTTVITATTTASQLVTAAANPALPINVGAGTTTLIGFTYTNTGTQAVFGTPFSFTPPTPITSTVTVNPSTTGTCLDVTNTCSGTNSLAAGASCSETCNFSTTATGNFTVTGSFNYDGPSVTLQEITNAGILFTIINNCTQGVGIGSSPDVWYSFSGAEVGQSCTVSSCPAGSNCFNGQCYWNNPTPTSGGFHLPSNATSTVIIPDLNPSNDIIWQGSFAGRTGCSGASCATANCNTTGGNNPCDPGTSFNSPSTQSQITLRRTNSDTYLVETINGFTVSMSVAPNQSPTAGNPYVCGTPGSLTGNATSTQPGCPWAFSVPNSSFNWVPPQASETPCVTSTDCTVAGTMCGLRYNPSVTPTFALICAPQTQQLGFWTANEACLLNAADANTFFNCSTVLTSPYSASTYTLTNLYACSPTTNPVNPGVTPFVTCYSATPPGTCCGCTNWSALVPPTTAQCGRTDNTQWNSNVLPNITWIKTGCPTVETYPFDTASSTFTCPATTPTPPNTNIVSYTISFCPTS